MARLVVARVLGWAMRGLLIIASLMMLPPGWGHAETPYGGWTEVALPAAVVRSLQHALIVDSQRADVHLEAARVTTHLSQLEPGSPFTPSLDVTWSTSGGGEVASVVRFSLTGWLLNPASLRDEAHAVASVADARLQDLLREADVVRSTVLSWVGLWRTTQQLRLLDLLAESPLPSSESVQASVMSLLAHRDRLAFDTHLQHEALLRAGAHDVSLVDDPSAWHTFILASVPSCVLGDVNVLLQTQALATTQATVLAEEGSARTPAVQLGADVDAAFDASVTPSWSAWLALGAPSEWPVAGSLRFSVSADEFRVSLDAAPTSTAKPTPDSYLLLAAAEEGLGDALQAARQEFDSLDFELRWLQHALDAQGHLLVRGPVNVASIESALSMVDRIAYGAEVQLHRVLACERERVASFLAPEDGR